VCIFFASSHIHGTGGGLTEPSKKKKQILDSCKQEMGAHEESFLEPFVVKNFAEKESRRSESGDADSSKRREAPGRCKCMVDVSYGGLGGDSPN